MTGTERIQSLARRLGEAIAEDERFKALKKAKEAYEADHAAQALEKDYDQAAAALREKMEQKKPLEPEEKRQEADLRTRVAENPTIQALLKAQVEFHQLMRKVNQTLESAIEL